MTFKRKNIRLSRDNYVGKRAYFVTICCEHRRPALRDTKLVTQVIETLRRITAKDGFAVHAYCFMQDHVHLLLEGLIPESQLLDFVSRFKQQTAFESEAKGKAALWQFKFYDHILRRADAMDDVAWYIWMNPVRKGICRDPWDYPYSGSFTMPWKARARPVDSWMPPWKKREAKVS